MKKYFIDLETRSDVDISKAGAYRYADSLDFDILLFAYSVNGSPVKVIDLASGEHIPTDIIKDIVSDEVQKHAFNAQFERVCLSAYIRRNYPQYFTSYSIDEDTVGDYLNPQSWRCTMVASAYLGLPLHLAGVGEVLNIEQKKMFEGKALIKYFCVPYEYIGDKPLFHKPSDASDKWAVFKAYNKRDVEAEMDIDRKVSQFPVPDFVWDEYILDSEINDRGIRIDMTLARNAIALNEQVTEQLKAELKRLTGVDNPNSVLQVKEWLEAHGVFTEKLGKKEVAELLETAEEPVRTVLRLRQQIAKSSVKKYTAMVTAACSDDRARGMFQFYGANRTGREAGRIIQLQNLPQNHMPDLESARSLVRSGDTDAVEMLYDDIPDTLSQLIRTAFIPREGYKFIVADFGQIEARVIAWLAGEQWRMEAFANGVDIYCASASKMFGVPVVKHGVNGELRAKGKVSELACIAEGQLVLTNHGLIPIEKVTTNDLLWDGEGWVEHDGVIYKGEREVITYEGLTATPDHLVWIEGQSQPVQLGVATACGTHLVQTGNGGTPIRLGENHKSGETLGRNLAPLLCAYEMLWLWSNSMDPSLESDSWNFQGLSELLTAEANSPMAGQTSYVGEATVRESQRQRLSQLWSERHPVRICECYGGRTVSDRTVWLAGTRNGDRQNRQQRRLCSREYPFCNAHRKQPKQEDNGAFTFRAAVLALCLWNGNQNALQRNDEGRNHTGCGGCSYGETQVLETHIRKARLYDIRNAGRHHRFTVSGKLVHNCGYGGSVGAMKAMGADSMGLTDEEMKAIVTDWRAASPKIVRLWYELERAALDSIKLKSPQETHGIVFSYEKRVLFVKLPSGRRLAYMKPSLGENRFGRECINYWGIGASKKWEMLETYSGKLTENIVQAIARDILFYAIKNLSNHLIVATVHDEMIIECKDDVSVEELCEQMSRTPPWAEGLLLRADGYECAFYRKD